MAMAVNGALRYLHADQLGSTVLTTYTSAARESERGYYAFGSDRRVAGTPATDHRFTGQKADGSGLYYYNARYYDPAIGQFVSPDTIVPAPGRVFAYNRYMYVFGNPLRYNDPTGHCASKAELGDDPVPDRGNDADCWTAVDGILHSAWDSDPEYWEARFTSKDVFYHWVAVTPSNDADFFVAQRQLFQEYTEVQTAERERLVNEYRQHNPTYGHNHFSSQVWAYCSREDTDCLTTVLDAISVTSASVAAACAASIIGNAGCSEVAGGISVSAGAISTARTAARVAQGEATIVDLTVSIATTYSGSKPAVGLVANLVQSAYDAGLLEVDYQRSGRIY